MMLAAGTRLGPYEILSVLGAGGMGEVYRARDTRLGRDVAIKVLPEHLGATTEIRARFEREARTISQLNHPNICALFDVGREGEIDFLVMELVEGETLAERLARGPLPVADVIGTGVQIADALGRAHRAGVIHRDLKPGNIMLARSGAKLMDFGLARATGMAGPAGASGVTAAALTQSPTIAQPLTAEGTLVGTFQYMAPEQLEGKEADARSDVWALGCVLYEMATGRRAFEGRSQASLISSIMSAEPAPISHLSPMAPPALDRVVRACLAKDPDERIQTAHDVSLQLRWEQETVSSAAASAGASAGPRRAWRDWIPWSVAGLAASAALAAWLTGGRGTSDADPLWALIQVPPEMTLTSYGCNVVISPDGRMVAFAGQDSSGASSDLWVRSLASTEARELSESGFASWPFWSPDGRSIAFFDQTGSTLMKVQVEGGRPVTICAAANGRGGSWNADNEIVFAPAPAGPLMRVSAAGGTPRAVTRIDSTRGETAHRFPSFLPDGRHFTYAALPRGPAGYEVYVASLDGGEPVHLMTADSAPVFAPPGYLLFRRGDQVMAQRFDPRRRTLRGDPVAIARAPGPSDLDADPIASASANGRLMALETGGGLTRLELVDRGGATRRTYPLPAGAWRVLSTTPDGRRALIGRAQEIWFVDLERSIPTRFVTDLGTDASGVTSPDGRRVAYLKNREGREGIVVVDLAGRVEFEVYPDDLYKTITDWSPDGRYIVYRALDPETDWDIWLLPTEGDRTPVRLIGGPDWDMNGRVSPDGRWMAYAARELEGRQVYVTSFPEPDFKIRVTPEGGGLPTWGRGGRELYFWHRNTRFAVPMEPGEEARPGTPVPLYTLETEQSGKDVMQDGERFLVTRGDPSSERRLRLLLNWTALLER